MHAEKRKALQPAGWIPPTFSAYGHIIDKLSGAAMQQLHKPTPHEVVLVTDRPWEGNTCAYYTVRRICLKSPFIPSL